MRRGNTPGFTESNDGADRFNPEGARIFWMRHDRARFAPRTQFPDPKKCT
jgi:hypothetical protein